MAEHKTLSMAALSRLIRWSRSRNVEKRKGQVIAEMYDILLWRLGRHVFGSGTYGPTTGWAYPAYLVDGEDGYIACDEDGGSWCDVETFEEDWRISFHVPEHLRRREERIDATTEALRAHARNAAHTWTTEQWRTERPGRRSIPPHFYELYEQAPDRGPLSMQQAYDVWWVACWREGMHGVALIERAERQARQDQLEASQAAPTHPGAGGLTTIIAALAAQRDDEEQKRGTQ